MTRHLPARRADVVIYDEYEEIDGEIVPERENDGRFAYADPVSRAPRPRPRRRYPPGTPAARIVEDAITDAFHREVFR